MAASDHLRDFAGTDRFAVVKRLGAGGMGVVYEAYDREREQPVALKTLLHVSPDAIFRFKREFRSLAEIVHPHLVSLYELFLENDRWFFTMELISDGKPFLSHLSAVTCPRGMDVTSMQNIVPTMLSGSLDGVHNSVTLFDEQTLPSSDHSFETVTQPKAPMSSAQTISTPRAFRLQFNLAVASEVRRTFRELTEGVLALHTANKLHRDLKPGNVLLRGDGRVVILDFGLVLERDNLLSRRSAPTAAHSGSDYDTDTRLAGTIAYMSPEQAGGEGLSEASDWYSVGVMLFEALSGNLPFEGKSSEVLLAKQAGKAAPPLDHHVTGVPEDLSALCRDLLQSQSSARPTGVEILSRFSEDSSVSTTSVEATAASELFVGRERDMQILVETFDRMLQGGTSILHLYARSGLGKTALLEHFLATVAEKRKAVVFRGRCYEQESVPYKALDSVVDALSVFLVRLPQGLVAELVPPNISALARVFPVLTRAPAVRELSEREVSRADLSELRQRAFAALQELLFRIGERFSLVVCIDDLQWGDADSAALLLQLLKGPRAPRLLLLVSYRSEYAETSTCIRSLRSLSSNGIHVVRLPVEALTTEETRELVGQISATHHHDLSPQDVDWIQQQAGGNPYFIYELVRYLRSGQSTSTRVELDDILWQRINQLDEPSRELLEVVAVSSQPIQLRYAKQAAELAVVPPQMVTRLRSQHLVRSTGPRLNDEIETYHDRIRESVLANLPQVRLKDHHRSLAASLESAADVAPEVLARHYQFSDQSEKAAEKYERAAERAVHALAFERAEDFYQHAMSLTSLAKVKVRVAERLVHFYTDLARFRDAYDTGRRALVPLGMKLSANFNPVPFVLDLAEDWLRFRGRTIASIADLPESSDPRLISTVRLLAAMGKAAYQLRPELCIAILVKLVNRCLRSGNTPDCAVGYMAVGTIFIGGILGRHRDGYEFGNACLELVEKYDNGRQRAEVNFVVGYFGTSWLRPASEAERLWEIAYQAGLQSGDLFHTGCACCATVLSQFMRGVPLDEVWAKTEDYVALLRRFSLHESLGATQAVRQAIRNLRGVTLHPDRFDTEDFDEAAFEVGLAGYGSRHFAHYYWIMKMQVLYLRGQHQRAIDTLRLSEEYVGHSKGMLHSTEHKFYSALILASDCSRKSGFKRTGQLISIRGAQRNFEKWAKDCPDNFLSRERILRAEISRLTSDRRGALRAYDEAAECAQRFGQLQIAALAYQLASRLLIETDRSNAAHRLARAQDCYCRWGATRYAADLSLSSLPS